MATEVQTDGTFGSTWPRIMIITVTAGNSLVVIISQGQTATFSVSDNLNGAYTEAIQHTSDGKTVGIFYRHNCAGGSITISANSDQSGNGQAITFEINGIAGAPVDDFKDNVSTISHVSSQTALSGAGFGICSICQAIDVAHTAGSGWTARDGTAEFAWAQRRTGTMTSNQGDFTTDSATNSVAAMAIFSNTPTGGYLLVRN